MKQQNYDYKKLETLRLQETRQEEGEEVKGDQEVCIEYISNVV